MNKQNVPRESLAEICLEAPAFASKSALPTVARRWLVALGLSIVSTYILFFVVFFGRAGPRDGDQYLVFHSLQYWNASLFGLAKQWTPLMCSGLPLAGEPQVPFMSLSMAMGYVLGPLYGVRFATAIYMALGGLGAFLYSGLWSRVTGFQLLAAALFVGNGFFICRLGYGHFDFLPFLLLPLLLWSLHFSLHRRSPQQPRSMATRAALHISLLSAVIALAIDGSPVSIIHLIFWVALYALILSVAVRSFVPAGVLASACCLAALLDAGYLWPMLEWQSTFSRPTPDRFTSLFSFLWFALLPLRGKLLPANGKGHELSVFIGPIIALLIFKYRQELGRSIPPTMKVPLLGVSLFSLAMGMGSMKGLHVPSWLSLFDLLRPLPGFRSIGVTGRYWGFLALPLSLLGAAALWRFASEYPVNWRYHGLFAAAVALQVGFQVDTLTAHWWRSPEYRSADLAAYFRHGPETIDYAIMRPGQLQGQMLTPTRGVSNCYDMDDFTRTDVGMNDSLVERTSVGAPGSESIDGSLHGRFASWNHIQIGAACASSSPASVLCTTQSDSPAHISLRQAYHPLWKAEGCTVLRGVRNNLTLDCPANRLRSGIDIQFRDSISEVAAHVSLAAWMVWLCVTAVIGLLVLQDGTTWRRFVARRRVSAGKRLPA